MEYGEPLYGATVKLVTARERFAQLQGLITELTEHVTMSSVRFEPHPNGGKDVVIFRWTQQPPVKWSVILGEIIHDFRSALDHTIYQLTLHHSKGALKKTEFPIFRNETEYFKTTQGGGHYKIRGIPPEAIPVIDRVQPFEAPKAGQALDEHPLWILQELSNIDKHRTLHLVSIRTDSIHVKVSEETQEAPVPPDLIWTSPPGRVEDGTILASWPHGACKGKMHVDCKLSWHIALQCDELPSIRTLPIEQVVKAIGKTTEHIVVKLLAPFLPK